MSVATKNPFAILDAEDSSRPSSPAPAPAAAAPAPAPPAPPAGRSSQKPRGGPAARGGKYYQRGGANPKSPGRAEDGSGNLNQNGVEDAQDAGRKLEVRGRGRGGGRGGSRGAGGRGRPFDKHSQTGKTDSNKKIHQSWGGDDGKTELKAEEAASNDAVVESTTDWAAPAGNTASAADQWTAPAAAAAAAVDEWGAPAAAAESEWGAPGVTDIAAPATPAEGAEKEGGAGRQRREREPEEEDNTLTLDQYLAQKKETSVVPKLEGTRKANEGADANIWKDVVPLQKEEEDAYFVGKAKAAPKTRNKKEEKVFLEIDAHFERPRTGPPRGGRGGRGGDRGDRGDRGGDRGGRGRGRGDRRGGGPPFSPRGSSNFNNGNGNNAPVNVDDETAFPSLS